MDRKEILFFKSISDKWLNNLMKITTGDLCYWTRAGEPDERRVREVYKCIFVNAQYAYGYADLEHSDKMTVDEAWDRYGSKLGLNSLPELIDEIKKVSGGDGLDVNGDLLITVVYFTNFVYKESCAKIQQRLQGISKLRPAKTNPAKNPFVYAELEVGDYIE